MSARQRRTRDLGVVFSNGTAVGWFFGVPDVFKAAMDIKFLPYVDREKTEKLRKEKGASRDAHGNLYVVKKWEWTRGVPPSRTFNIGDVFYRPAEVRTMEWGDALLSLSHLVAIKDAMPDDEHGEGGWVKFELSTYSNGKRSNISKHEMTQYEFELFLKDGPSCTAPRRPK